MLLAVTSAFAYGTPGITSDDFSTRLNAALIGFGNYQDITATDQHMTTDGYEVYTYKVNAATITTTSDPDSGILMTVEMSFPYDVISDMMEETSAVISSFYTDSVLSTRIFKATKFLNELAVAITSSTGLTTEVDIEGYTLTLNFGGLDVVYTFSVDLDGGSPSSNSESQSGIVGETVSELNAVQAAKNYLDYSAFSREGLIKQLKYEGHSNTDAAYGADYSGADWNEQAAKSAKSYLDYTSFSRQGLIKQLEYDGFTHEQAVYGADASGFGNDESPSSNISSGETISQKNAVHSAKNYLDYAAFSRKGLIKQLEYEGYSNADAVFGTDNAGADWKEQAVKCAKAYLDFSAFSKKELVKQLEYDGFSHEQAVYGADGAGL